MDKIRASFERLTKLNQTDWEAFKSKLTPKSYSKREVILKLGQTENYLSFIESGIVRMYLPKVEGDMTFSFAFSNEFVSAYDSFLTQTPCGYETEALTATKLWQISYNDLQQIYNQTEKGNEIGRKNAEQLFLKKSKRELSLLYMTAEERYVSLFSERPELIEKIPLKYVASYIGVTPQALSRIRKRIS